MYSVSNDYLLAVAKPIIQYDLKGTIDGNAFVRTDVLDCSITNQCSGNDEVAIGSVYIGELNITLNMDLNNNDLIDKAITLECGVKLADESFEYVPMGIYTIASVEKSNLGLIIKAYDNMSKLDKAVSDQVNGTAYEIATFICAQCNVTLANDDFDDFANHTQRLIEYPESDIETFRDMIYWLAQAMGAYVTANRLGQIEFRYYGMTVNDTLDTNRRFTGGKFADYETYYTGISVVNIEDNTTSYYGLQIDDGLTMNLGANPFLQYDDLETSRRDVLTMVSSFVYVPYSVNLIANPAYDLGDVLSFPNGLGDSSKKFVITKYVWKYNKSNSISGGGKNPKLLSVKSKVEKELDGIRKRQSDKDVIQYYSFTNTIDLQINDGDSVTIVDIRYSALKKTVAIFLAEILADIDTTVSGVVYTDCKAEFLYYIDGLLISRTPKETWFDGDHIKHLLQYLITEAGTVHHLEIKCHLVGGSGLIKMGDIKACVYGQNLAASDSWDGWIRIDESFEDIELPTMIFGEYADVVNMESI